MFDKSNVVVIYPVIFFFQLFILACTESQLDNKDRNSINSNQVGISDRQGRE